MQHSPEKGYLTIGVSRTVDVFDCIGILLRMFASKGTGLAPSCHVAPPGRQRGSKPHCLLPSFSWVAWARQPWPCLGCPVLPQGPSSLPGGYAAACEPHHMPQGHQRRRHFPLPGLSSPFMVTAWLPESGARPTNSSGKTLASVLGLI